MVECTEEGSVVGKPLLGVKFVGEPGKRGMNLVSELENIVLTVVSFLSCRR